MPVVRSLARSLALSLSLALAIPGGAASAAGAVRTAAPEPVPQPCPDVDGVWVASRDPADRRTACAGAADALGFFQGLGLGRPDRLRIDVVDAMPREAGVSPDAAGCWLRDRQRILILTYPAFRRAGRWFGVPIDRRLHRSVATHETAHALAGCNFARPDPPVQAQEYVAYVTLFETMDPAQRARVLKAVPDPAFDDEARINAMVYLFDPMRFGVRAWRHYRTDGNGPAFLNKVLAGDAITE